MLRADENIAKIELQQAIQTWIEETEIKLPFVGDNVVEIMANAALQVMLGIADTQEYLEREDMLSD
ncbi:MAG: hypothetical protein KDJ97_37125 [Anaerolineae bacterium]|nr:hypothetical protein [Anaerolineae bacterium]